MQYIYNDKTGEIAQCLSILDGWRKATKEEIEKKLLDDKKLSYKQLIEMSYNKAVQKGFTYNDEIYKIDEISISNMIGKADYGSQCGDKYKWFNIDKKQINFKNARSFKKFVKEVYAYKNDLMEQLNHLKASVKKVKNIKDIEKIKIVFKGIENGR